MRIGSTALSAGFAALLAALPVASAKAQYYGPPCSPFPLTWPFCVAGAAVYTAGAIVTAPFRAVAPPPPAYYGYPYRPAYYPAYYPGWRYRRWCWNHPYRCRW
jgi:hypothetical protein